VTDTWVIEELKAYIYPVSVFGVSFRPSLLMQGIARLIAKYAELPEAGFWAKLRGTTAEWRVFGDKSAQDAYDDFLIYADAVEKQKYA
jgi:hypothetical protein